MVRSVLVAAEILGDHQRNRHGVSEHHLDSGGGDGGQIEGAQFSLERQMHVEIANGHQGIGANRGDADEKHALSLGAGDEAHELVGVAALAEHDEQIPGGENADVAVERVERGEEGGLDAERDERLGDLLGDEAGLADAGEENGALSIEEGVGEG